MAEKIPTTMRAAQWTPKDGAGMEKLLHVNASAPLPSNASTLPKNATLVKINYSSLNPVDYKLPEVSLARSMGMGKAPYIPACDFSGTVVNSTLPHLKPGDRVFGSIAVLTNSACAEYAVVTGTENVAKVPEGVSLKDAATVGIAGLTAYQCIQPYVKSGSNVLINGGSGGTGTYGVQIAKALGCKVVATCSGANADLVKSLGADQVVDYRQGDLVGQLEKLGTSFDLIVDNVNPGGPLYEQAHRYTTPAGRYVTIAGSPSLGSAGALAKTLLLPSWLGGGQRKAALVGKKENAQQLVQLGQWIAKGKVKPSIEKVYELDEIAEAFTRLKSGRTRGKIVIKVADE